MKYISLCSAVLVSALFVRSAAACPDIAGLADLNCDGQVRILCMGDSITAGEQDSTRLGYPGRLESIVLPGTNVRNNGVGGEETSAGRARLARFLSSPGASQYEYVIILEGVNDYFASNHSASATRNNLFTMERTASNAGGLPLLGSLTDIRRSQQRPWVLSVNSAIRGDVKIDFFSLGNGNVSSDGLHPNGNGYQRMAELAAAVLHQYSEANRPADTDHDGIYDFAEARFGTSASNPDSDGDGLLDGQEVFVYHTNPNLADTDGDGLSDYEEAIVRHTDPLSPLPTAPTITNLQAIP